MSSSLLTRPLSAARPRVETHPPHVDTFGPLAVQLGQMAGQQADPWQSDALDLILATREDGKWACFEYAEIVSRQNGKGAILELRALTGLLVLSERLILWSAHEYKTAMEAFRRVLWLLKQLGTQTSANLIDVGGIVVKVNNTNGEESFERLDTGARIKFVARSKGSGRGFSGDLIIIDEAFAYTPIQHAALLPTLSARPNPQIIYTSSPPLDGESGEVLFDLRDRGERGGDGSLGWRDWGAAGDLDHLDEIDLDDREGWAANNPGHPHRITEETIGRERRSLPPREFARERRGIWPVRMGAGGSVLDFKVWSEKMLDAESKRDGPVVLSWDITPMRDHATIGLYGLRADGLEHMQLVDYRPGTGWLVARLVELKQALDPLCFVVDAKNGGAAILDELAEHGITVPEDPEHPKRGDVLVLGTSEVADAVGQWIDAFRATPARFRHVGQQPLDQAVRNAKARPIGDAGQIAWGRKLSEVDIGPLCTVTWARYGWHAWHDKVTADYDPLANIG